VQSCETFGLKVSICGTAAGQSLDALALLAIGFRELSMPVGSVGPIKRMIRSMDLGAFSKSVKSALKTSNGSFRNELLGIARQHDILLADA
jgi:phosphotransferase system enzyme I (PtsP)